MCVLGITKKGSGKLLCKSNCGSCFHYEIQLPVCFAGHVTACLGVDNEGYIPRVLTKSCICDGNCPRNKMKSWKKVRLRLTSSSPQNLVDPCRNINISSKGALHTCVHTHTEVREIGTKAPTKRRKAKGQVGPVRCVPLPTARPTTTGREQRAKYWIGRHPSH